jgi:PTH1 family peptidyl-tRNA hydrolase
VFSKVSVHSGGASLIVGLGNPGDRYRGTRHNLGFRVLDDLAKRWRVGERRLECNALIGSAGKATLAWPQTFMNRSGYSIRCLVERHGFEATNILVVYDDVALPLGRLRMRSKGGPGGHRGMESAIRNLHTDEIARLRLGILPETKMSDEELSDFVLAEFAPEELETVEAMATRAADACESWLRDGFEVTMNRYNG